MHVPHSKLALSPPVFLFICEWFLVTQWLDWEHGHHSSSPSDLTVSQSPSSVSSPPTSKATSLYPGRMPTSVLVWELQQASHWSACFDVPSSVRSHLSKIEYARVYLSLKSLPWFSVALGTNSKALSMAHKALASPAYAYPNGPTWHHLLTPLSRRLLIVSTCLYPSVDCEVCEVRTHVSLAHCDRPSVYLTQCTVSWVCDRKVLNVRKLPNMKLRGTPVLSLLANLLTGTYCILIFCLSRSLEQVLKK